MKSRPFSQMEEKYIKRAAGKVPVLVMSEQLGCEVRKVRDFCGTRKIATKVPTEILRQHYPEVLKERRCRKASPKLSESLETTKIWSQEFGVSKKLAEFDRLLNAARYA